MSFERVHERMATPYATSCHTSSDGGIAFRGCHSCPRISLECVAKLDVSTSSSSSFPTLFAIAGRLRMSIRLICL